VGWTTLSIRQGSFSLHLFERYQKSEPAVLLALIEMVINGVATRKVTRITGELCGTQFCKSTVSELCKRLHSMVSECSESSLAEKDYRFVIADVIVVKVRKGGRVRSQRNGFDSYKHGRVQENSWDKRRR